MALSRKMLAAMDIPAEKIDEIISAHTETVSAIKEEKEALKADSDRLKTVEKELETAKSELEKIKSGDWEKKYTDLKSEYDGYKTAVETKAANEAKVSAYRKLLKEAGVNEKRIDTVLKCSKLDDIKLDKDGAIEGADKLTENIKDEWADFITTEAKQGANTVTPPANNGGKVEKPSLAAQMVAQYQAEHYGTKKED